MESRRLKNKKQELESYQKRVVAYAKRQKNPLYMLGDWLLTLCALGIILVEEIYKFFRYRLNLESFNRFLERRCALVSGLDPFHLGLSFTGHDFLDWDY